MNAKQIIRALQIDRRKLARWIQAGLPHRGRGRQMTFDQSAVRRWLLRKGFVRIDKPTVVKNQKLAAANFGITDRQFRTWMGHRVENVPHVPHVPPICWKKAGNEQSRGYMGHVGHVLRGMYGRKKRWALT